MHDRRWNRLRQDGLSLGCGTFRRGGAGNVIQYGVIETIGCEDSQQPDIIERAILRTLLGWRDEVASRPFRDADGNPVDVSVVMIDAGFAQDAVLSWCGDVVARYCAAKGIGGGRFQHGSPSPTPRVGNRSV